MKKTYFEKLKDPRWQKLRLKVMERNDFCCEMCGDNENTLNIHHKEYFKGHEPWEYELSQLSVLCEECHENITHCDPLKIISSYLALDGPFSRDSAAYLVAGFLGMPYSGFITLTGIANTKSGYDAYMAGYKSQKFLPDLENDDKN